MSSDTEDIQFLILLFSLFSVTFPNVIFSFLHQYLRNRKVYLSLMIIVLLLLLFSVFQIDESWKTFQKVNALSPIMIISYLILYKLADHIALKKYNRHMYFSCRISILFKSKESTEQTLLEMLIQILILILSAVIWMLLGSLIFNYF